MDLLKSVKAWIASREALFLNPLYSTLVTLLLLIAGGLGSVYSPEIRASVPLTWSAPPWSWSWEAAAFWAAALLSAVMFFLRQNAADRARQRAQEQMVDKASELEALIRTMPPANFLEDFVELITLADETADALISAGDADRAIVEQGVRHILRCVAVLAQKFDGDHRNTRYAANIMWVRPVDQIRPQELAVLVENLVFCDHEVSPDKFRALLVLDQALSTVATDVTASPDDQLRPMALPVPKETRSGSRYRVLPGAPMAVVRKEVEFYTDTSSLPKWCDESGDFTQGVKQQIALHFDSRSTPVRSFISIPICENGIASSSNPTSEPMAVLNIHCNRPGLLKAEDGPSKQFVSISQPLLLYLAKLLIALPSVDAGQQPPPIAEAAVG